MVLQGCIPYKGLFSLAVGKGRNGGTAVQLGIIGDSEDSVSHDHTAGLTVVNAVRNSVVH